MTHESKRIHYGHAQASRTKIKTRSFHLHIYANSSEYPDHHSVLSRRLEALVRQR